MTARNESRFLTWAELDEYVPLVAAFYERHGRDASQTETDVIVMLAKANAAANSQIAVRGVVRCAARR